ncbi:MAG: Uma2 family endonuclease [Candidatus Palauibacterales bacterium]|nr:Uma2 family endonuclease [Candidatus Palauibacterales bacterium]
MPDSATITWRDAQKMPEDGRRYEAAEGELYVTAAPSFRHQRICHRLQVRLDDLLERPGHGVIAAGPVGVEFPATEEGVQPDLIFVSEERRGIIADDWIRGAPDLVVEILSPSTGDRDRGVKLKLYRRQGVGEYWVVDPEEDAVEVWRFGASGREGETTHERYTERLPVRIGDEVVGEIDLAEIFVRDS